MIASEEGRIGIMTIIISFGCELAMKIRNEKC